MKKRSLNLIALAFSFVLFAGCGNNTAASPTVSSSASPSTAPTAAVSSTPKASVSPSVSQAVITKAGTLHNTKLNVDVSLGMKKDVIDKALGTPSTIGVYYYYPNALMTVSYTNDIAVIIATSNPNWESMDKIKVGTSLSDVKKLYGDPPAGDTGIYYFDKDSKLTSNASSSAANMVFQYQNDKVSNIQLVGKA